MGKDKLSVAYRQDCARAEEEALKTLRSVHMPVINIPSIRDITLGNCRRRMVKWVGKIKENDIVLVAATDFVAASLACPTLFGWSVEDNNEQVSALLADLARRWTHLLSVDAQRRAAHLALLESSLRCLDDRHAKHFAEARRAGRTDQSQLSVDALDQSQLSVSSDNQPQQAIVDLDQSDPPVVELDQSQQAIVDLDQSPPSVVKLDQSRRSVPNDRPIAAEPAKPTPPPKTLLSYFKPRVPKPVADGDDLAPKVFASSQGTMLVFAPDREAQTQNEHGTKALDLSKEAHRVRLANPFAPSFRVPNQGSLLRKQLTNRGQPPLAFTNHGSPSQNLTNQGYPPQNLTNHGSLPQNLTNQSSLPLVNATNLVKPSASVGKATAPVNALTAMMAAAKENNRKRATTCRKDW